MAWKDLTDGLGNDKRLALRNNVNWAYNAAGNGGFLPQVAINTANKNFSPLSTPYYDSVQFHLVESGKNLTDAFMSTDEIINCLIAVKNEVRVTKYDVLNSTNSVKQVTGVGDYDITFQMKLVKPLQVSNTTQLDENACLRETKSKLGNGIAVTKKIVGFTHGGVQDAYKTNAMGGVSNKIEHDYLPNKMVANLDTLIRYWSLHPVLTELWVTSKYLNDNFSVFRLCPYSWETSQNEEYTNTYIFTIGCYSDAVMNVNDNKSADYFMK